MNEPNEKDESDVRTAENEGMHVVPDPLVEEIVEEKTDGDIVIEYPDDKTPAVGRDIPPVCPMCGKPLTRVENSAQPPAAPHEAWKIQTCTSTLNEDLWGWCRTLGELRLPSQGIMCVKFDRRSRPRSP